MSKGAGKWAESGGENAKFGLSTVELLTATEMLKAENLGHCLKLLHFHIGSQVPDILTVKKAVQEAARFYAKLHKMGFAIEFMDVGGGLGVDYDGAQSRLIPRRITRCRNTRTTLFITSPTFATRRKCRIRTSSAKAAAPSSRITACLIVEVFGAIEKIRPGDAFKYGDSEHALVRELLDIKKNLAKANKLEAFHDAQERKEDAQQMFALGLLDLPDKAHIENLYWEISREVVRELSTARPMCRRKSASSKTRSPTSISAIFPSSNRCSITGRSANCFPSCPSARLNERPTREATLVDITCDSDGAGQQVH